eukprot:CAMPEP_0181171378 /NCGR_PEP_ID=MMETSP1096-20121128/1875_1 /TAXON_ID=156174 ORGANISM="Chrysochromulina ericina, Strain CCMP281" /NCGR_SAMPLE_ID=MMETSP1096 /ASSEMBLY_ACC=CAM_ASM_000453 /LENGTH=112 /DNA_ID=CAMNT_0023259017 /DNA_START=213 /DNA_END=551 /DNA_ORIENTATION=+
MHGVRIQTCLAWRERDAQGLRASQHTAQRRVSSSNSRGRRLEAASKIVGSSRAARHLASSHSLDMPNGSRCRSCTVPSAPWIFTSIAAPVSRSASVAPPTPPSARPSARPPQ